MIRYVPTVKRGFDLVVSLVLLVLLAPILLVVAIAIWAKLGRPIVFRQTRPGQDGRPFQLRKFRTMSRAIDANGQLLPDAQRLSRFGSALRASSLDELPELLNVLAGEMSLVGPRPLLTQYLARYSPAQARRHELKPGITGWAQVNGRNSLDWEDRFVLDVWYVDHCSFALDLRILGRTALQVLRRDGIAQPGQATMTEFMGHSERK